MRIIKRYANRKLYDTGAKRYVTLEDIGGIVRSGEDVQVFDNNSGEEVTSVTLAQVLHETEKRAHTPDNTGFFTSVLQKGARLKKELVDRADRVIGPQIESALRALRIPSRNEFDQLRKAITALEVKVAALDRKLKKK